MLNIIFILILILILTSQSHRRFLNPMKLKYIQILLPFLFLCISCKTLSLKEIDKKFAEGKYFEAAEDYRKLYSQTSPKKKELRKQLAYRIGEAYRLVNNPIRSSVGYQNAVRYGEEDVLLHLQYGRTLHKLGKYKEAIKQYELFLESYPENMYALNALESCQQLLDQEKSITKYKVEKMSLFDMGTGSAFAPALLPLEYDQVYFTSSMGKNIIGDTVSGITGQKNNDIFFSRKDEQGKWMKPEHLESDINTKADEGVVSFNAQGTSMYYTYAPIDSTSQSPTSIYVSRREAGNWSKGERIELSKNDSVSVFAHPAISPSEEYLYFVSDMPGGYGGKDIWRAKMYANQVEYIENLGPQINTAGDEVFPYMRTDSTLFFSSDGHGGLGGLDIFRATFDATNNTWSLFHYPHPINSEADDFGITFGKSNKNGFLSSNRGDARGYDHIYSFGDAVSEALIDGFIVDTDDEFIADATVHIVGKDGTNIKIKGENGTYNYDAGKGVDYVMLGSSPNHLNARQFVNTIDHPRDSIYIADFVLIPIFKPVVLENIFFEFDKATLLPESKKELDGLIEILEVNPNVAIELSAHTDRKGTDEYNINLSKRRAEAVMDYLINVGRIEKDRLTAVGKGKSEPKIVTRGVIKRFNFLKEGDVLTPEFIDTLDEEQQEMADQINRRTEFKVSSITYNLK